MNTRENTREVVIGDRKIGNNNPVLIQSMTNTKTRDVEATVKQIHDLTEAGCDIVRVAVMDMECAEAIKEIKKAISIPLVADIHFDYRLALQVIENGIDKVRINPGNIGDSDRIRQVVEACKEKKIPIRIGVNGGSLEKDILKKYGHPTAEALVESAMGHIKILEDLNFYDIVVSMKASDVKMTVDAYTLLSEKVNYPLHLGITEAGTLEGGTIKSSVGLGIMLAKGLGDTIRVSLTGDPVDEIRVAKKILAALDLRDNGIKFISCPTCGRTSIDLITIAKEVESKIGHLKIPITVAVMGCAVNGPGEAREADIGIAGGNGVGLIFKKGQIVAKVKEELLVERLIEEINLLISTTNG